MNLSKAKLVTTMWPRVVALLVLMLAVLAAPHLKADAVYGDAVLFTDNGDGTGSMAEPPNYFDSSFLNNIPGTGASCSFYTVYGSSVITYAGYYPVAVCGSGVTQVATEGYLFSLADATNTIPAGTVYVGDALGYVSDEIVATFPAASGCGLPDGTVTSDPAQCALYVTFVQFSFTFGLDLTGSPVTCASVGGCHFTYNGAVQTVGVITWGSSAYFGGTPPGNTTTLLFQGVSSVPESNTFFALALGLLGLAWLKLFASYEGSGTRLFPKTGPSEI
jgi:hypothetical protein